MDRNLSKLSRIEAVTERDIDLLLLEELNSAPEFGRWIRENATEFGVTAACKGAWHSITDPQYGESDIITLYEDRFAILIENKIDAVAQPDQGLRYKKRGEAGIEGGAWDRFTICMIAPQRYLDCEQDAQAYDAVIRYENVIECFTSSDDTPRSRFKAFLLAEAIEQNRRGYKAIPDGKVTAFWYEYWKLTRQIAPELGMRDPGPKPAGADWPAFRPASLSPGLSVVHKWRQGTVDLQVSNAADKIEKLAQEFQDTEFEVIPTGKSASIRLRVSALSRFASFASQSNAAQEGIRAALKLTKLGSASSHVGLDLLK